MSSQIPSHRYAYTFELFPRWSHFYSHAKEIREYIEQTATKYNAQHYVKFEHKLTAARWDEDAGQWHLDVENKKGSFRDTVDIL
jgi:cation diffusion facilitator CzcD-associated flavoprotein CzcO